MRKGLIIFDYERGKQDAIKEVLEIIDDEILMYDTENCNAGQLRQLKEKLKEIK